ncbi:secondary thiamine-phosphate synthase enzyme YjbQ [Ferroglobus sp.]|uniref:secondary thiamine-phosphate synthase enzyme YjbQ n=1 Tax=Ferroglobus sp. TaxID=2614230 RepID=UPI0025BF0A18|nr:secondary thiamine-phosphate synthase enzyme YjbQ [Ferroglobus sp.]
MKILEFEVERDGMVDLTEEIKRFVKESKVNDGAVLVFSVGSTGAITTIEYEPGLKKDFPAIMEKIAPYNYPYEHHKTWGDDNGSSHVKASIVGPSVLIPFKNKELMLGTWQQVVLINFDTRKRRRKVVLQILGEVE